LNSAEYRFRLPVIGSVLHRGEPSLTICPKNRGHLTRHPEQIWQREQEADIAHDSVFLS